MKFRILRSMLILIVAGLLFVTIYTLSEPKSVYAQQPTGSIPTVTGTPAGPMASIKYGTSEGSVRIRSGPGTLYEQVGIMLEGESVPVLGKSPGGDWLLIEYHGVAGGSGWVSSFYMDITAGEIPLAELPEAAQPKVTITIDPTLAAQFVTTPLATRMPTYTPSAPLTIPTFESNSSQIFAGIPVGIIIIALLCGGGLTTLFTIMRGR